MYKDISLNVQLFQREIVIEPNICFEETQKNLGGDWLTRPRQSD